MTFQGDDVLDDDVFLEEEEGKDGATDSTSGLDPCSVDSHNKKSKLHTKEGQPQGLAGCFRPISGQLGKKHVKAIWRH